MTHEMRSAILNFANEHGRAWKTVLRDAWMKGETTGLLQQVRNVIGPSGLDRIKTDMLKAHEVIERRKAVKA